MKSAGAAFGNPYQCVFTMTTRLLLEKSLRAHNIELLRALLRYIEVVL
jgi:hypothetical protein